SSRDESCRPAPPSVRPAWQLRIPSHRPSLLSLRPVEQALKLVATPRDDRAIHSARVMPLLLEMNSPGSSVPPGKVGLPLMRGPLQYPEVIELGDEKGRQTACQTEALARWSDGSVRWMLLDFVAAMPGPGRQEWALHFGHQHSLSTALTIEPVS